MVVSIYVLIIFELVHCTRVALTVYRPCVPSRGNSIFPVCLYAVLYIISYFPVEFLSM